MKLYVASSWRNKLQPSIVQRLRELKYEVYDFRNPESAFDWTDINRDWKKDLCHGEGWKAMPLLAYRDALKTELSQAGFKSDFDAMEWADACVLVLPCGRSAHLEAGWFAGQGKPLIILLNKDGFEPELMYLMATDICVDMLEVQRALERVEGKAMTEVKLLKQALSEAILSQYRTKSVCVKADPAGGTYEVDWLPRVKEWAALCDLNLDKHDPFFHQRS